MSSQFHTFDADGTWETNTNAPEGEMILKYSGDLGGGTLRIYSNSKAEHPVDGYIETPVPDSKLSAATVDDNSDAIQQVLFRTRGKIIVKLSGATNPDVTVILE